ncbi:hypothetical protein L3Q82_024517 [Scortum barcoo]|uniref:Uncharacterized protein n=1 Tax=Scortum barcoo TaxID=214431 RepID=A0ACB8WPI5_9TELE|nr:hypothetical protein L3Q82_024517 [Scortum barcoo]
MDGRKMEPFSETKKGENRRLGSDAKVERKQREDKRHEKWVTGQTKSGSQAHHEQKNIKDRYVARIGVTGAPPWSQAWGWGSQAKRAWWPGLCPRDPAGLSPPEMATWARLPVGSPPLQEGP